MRNGHRGKSAVPVSRRFKILPACLSPRRRRRASLFPPHCLCPASASLFQIAAPAPVPGARQDAALPLIAESLPRPFSQFAVRPRRGCGERLHPRADGLFVPPHRRKVRSDGRRGPEGSETRRNAPPDKSRRLAVNRRLKTKNPSGAQGTERSRHPRASPPPEKRSESRRAAGIGGRPPDQKFSARGRPKRVRLPQKKAAAPPQAAPERADGVRRDLSVKKGRKLGPSQKPTEQNRKENGRNIVHDLQFGDP